MKVMAAHLGSVVVAVALACVGLPSLCRAQTLLSEDFESGGQGWTTEPLWHISQDGECGAVTRMAAYDFGPPACDYYRGGHGTLFSPEFTLTGGPSIGVEFDYLKMTDADPYFESRVLIVRGDEAIVPVAGFPDTPTVRHFRGAVSVSPFWSGTPVRLAFYSGPNYADPSYGSGSGWMIDNVKVTNRPLVYEVYPNHGPNSGVSGLKINGIGLLGATAVDFGGHAASFTVDSDQQITADLGLTSFTGFVDVSVTASSWTGSLTNGFDYFAPPNELGRGCSTSHLSWSGSPTLGQVYTVTVESLGSDTALLLVDWSTLGSKGRVMSAPPCPIYVSPDSVIGIHGNPSHSFFIPSDATLIGAHLRAQAKILRTPVETTQVLDATIGR